MAVLVETHWLEVRKVRTRFLGLVAQVLLVLLMVMVQVVVVVEAGAALDLVLVVLVVLVLVVLAPVVTVAPVVYSQMGG
jgi:hypothetical protein